MPFQPADRLNALPPYLFVEIDRRKRAALAAGVDVIDLGVGDPDRPTHRFLVDRLKTAVENPVYHRYPPDRGLAGFRQQVSAFFAQRYGVTLDPEREVLSLIGTKEGLGHLPLAVVNPGQAVLVPDPGYPVYHSATLFAGGTPHRMPLLEERGWLPDLDAIPLAVVRDAALMFLNYPNNPTGAVARLDFFEQAVDFARRHDLVIAQDAAYNEMGYDFQPPSILQVSGATDVAIELHSLSKTFNMTGWRLGFAVGNPEVLAALGRIKSNIDSGQFSAIQEVGIEAYQNMDRPELRQMRDTYRARADVLISGLRELGFRVRRLEATFYVWAGVPAGCDGMQVASRLLDEAAVVCIPGLGFGQAGRNFVRFALTVDADRIRRALDRMRAMKW